MTQEQDLPILQSIAVIGGTGKEGGALAKRWALNGYRVIIGSRSAERAQAAAEEMNQELGSDYLIGMENADAARAGRLVVLSVPYSAHRATLEAIQPHLSGKILVDLTVPIQPGAFDTVYVPEGKSAGLEAQEFVGDSVRVVSAFQNVSYARLKNPNNEVECDVLVCGDDAQAKEETLRLVEGAGLRGLDAGPLANSVAAEALTPVLLYINRRYKAKHAGIRITGVD